MSEDNTDHQLKLDPWVASSLLQKSIRRGEVELAQRAVGELYHHRGAAVFRRLCTIAVEDIGIADVTLLQEIVGLTSQKGMRSVLGSDLDLLTDLASRMALATKDRSADYVYCAATQLDTALADRSEFAKLPFQKLLTLTTDEQMPLTRRAVAALLACTVDGKDEPVLDATRVRHFLDTLPVKAQHLQSAVLELARMRGEVFCVTLPLIWSRWWQTGCSTQIVRDEVPASEELNGLPLYALDKHTAAGKRAIARLYRENSAVSALLRRHVAERQRAAVAEIAAFYADAAPVARRLHWPTGWQLRYVGSYSDMTHAGCPAEAVPDVLRCVEENLPELNRLRAAEMASRGTK